ncbi:MMPL family transporter [Desulfatiferula olefinivorans]
MDIWIDRIVRHYVLVGICLLILTVPFAYFYTQQKYDNHVTMFFDSDDPVVAYYRQFQEQYGNDEVAAIVFRADDIFTPEAIGLIRGISETALALPGVENVMSLTETEVAQGDDDTVEFRTLIPADAPLTGSRLAEIRREALSHPVLVGNLISADGTTTAVMIELTPMSSNETKHALLKTLRDRVEAVAGGRVTLFYSGGPYLEVEIEGLTGSDNLKFTPITFFIIIFVVYMLLRNMTLSLLGQLNITVIVLWGIGLLIMCGESINTVTVIIAPVLLAISIADSIHILSFYKESYVKNGGNHREAVARSIGSLWFPCLFTSVTTGIGYLSFVTTTVRPVKTVGVFTSIGVMIAFFMTMVLLPVLLMIFRKRLGKGLAGERRRRPSKGPDLAVRALDMLGRLVTTHHTAVAVLFLIIAVVTSAGIIRLRFETDFVSYLKDDNPLKQDIAFIEETLRGTVPVEVVFHAGSPDHDFTNPESLALLARVQNMILTRMDGQFTSAFSAVDYVREIHRAFNPKQTDDGALPHDRLDVLDYYELGDTDILRRVLSPDRMDARMSFASRFGSTEKSKEFNRYMDTTIAPLLGERLSFTHTGMSTLYVTMDRNLKISQARSFGSAFVLIFIMMYFVCKNIRLTVLSMVPNLFPILVTLGIMGWFGIPLDGSTIMIASVTIGIAVDDTIHFITWFRRNALSGLDTRAAVIKTFRDTGKPIVMTSVVLSIAYFVLTTGSVKPIIAFGALAGMAMVFALLGDLFILPALIMIVKPSFRARTKKTEASPADAWHPALAEEAE